MFHFLTNNLRLPSGLDNNGNEYRNQLVQVYRYCPKTAATEVSDELRFQFATQDFNFDTIELVYDTNYSRLSTPDEPGFFYYYYKLQGNFTFIPLWYTQESEA